MVSEIPDDVQRWTAKRRVAPVVSILKSETSVAEAARKHGLTVAEIAERQERLVVAAENALRTRPKDEDLLNIPNYHVYLKLLIDGAESRPFSAVTIPPAELPARPPPTPP
jgi:hypothetical protein